MKLIGLQTGASAVASSDLSEEVQWTRSEAIELCFKIETICPKYGCHVALTGGLLYKQGIRKDCDIVLYRIRQVAKIDLEGLWVALNALDFVKHSGFGWCYKCTYRGKSVDCLIPEEQGDEYNPPEQ
jgi:hypothetical protein